MGLVDYESSASSSDEEGMTQLKQPSHPPPAAVTLTSALNSTTKSKKPTKRGERSQRTANFFLPPKMQEALLVGDISSDSEDSNDDDGVKIRVKQRDGEKGLLDILPAPSCGTSKGRGGLGEVAAKIVASQINNKAKKSNIIDDDTTTEEKTTESQAVEREDEEGKQKEDNDIISCVQQEIGLIGKAKKTSHLMPSQQVASVADTAIHRKQHSSTTHDSVVSYVNKKNASLTLPYYALVFSHCCS